MAEKKKRVLKQKKSSPAKKRRLTSTRLQAFKPLGDIAKVLKKVFGFVKIPDNRITRVFGKRLGFIPRYFKEAWQEIRQVSWPNRQETTRLTIAVFIFSVIFTVIVAVLDFGLDKIFRELIVD